MLRFLAALPLILGLILFALSNRQIVTLSFWPSDYSVQLPLAIALLFALCCGFLLGALVVWIESLSQRLRARRAEQRVALLESQNQALQAAQANLHLSSALAPTLAAIEG